MPDMTRWEAIAASGLTESQFEEMAEQILAELEAGNAVLLQKHEADRLRASEAARCPSCDHLTIGHQQDGCWYAVTTGTPGRDLVCPCTVPAAAFAPTACRGCATSLATCWAEGARCCDACAHPAHPADAADAAVCPHGKPISADRPAITTTAVTFCTCCGDSFNGRISGSDRCKKCRTDTTGETDHA